MEGGTVRASRYLIAVAGVGLLAGGCGTVHAGQSSTSDTLVSAVSHTAAQTARITITEAIQSTGMSMSFTQTGEFDFAHSRGMIAMTAPADMTELFLPPRMYIKISGDGSMGLPHGKTWVAIDTGTALGSTVSPLSPFGGGDPADMLTSLTAIAGGERVLGTGTVRGVRVTEYQVDIDPAKIVGKLSGQGRASLRQFAKSLGKGTIPVDVWVDGQNQVRQMRLAVPMPAFAQLPGNARLTETIDFYDFGTPVRVSAPPASQVVSMGSAGMLGSSVSVAGSASSAAPLPAVSTLVPGAAGSAGAVAPVPPGPFPFPTSSPLPSRG